MSDAPNVSEFMEIIDNYVGAHIDFCMFSINSANNFIPDEIDIDQVNSIYWETKEDLEQALAERLTV